MTISADLINEIVKVSSYFDLSDECRRLVAVLEESKVESPVYTHKNLMELTGIESAEVVQQAINILKSPRFRLYEQAYRFLDDDELVHPIDVETLRDASASGALMHPALGYAVRDFKDRTYVVFIGHKEGISR